MRSKHFERARQLGCVPKFARAFPGLVVALGLVAAAPAIAGGCDFINGVNVCYGFFNAASGQIALDKAVTPDSAGSGRDGGLGVSAGTGGTGVNAGSFSEQLVTMFGITPSATSSNATAIRILLRGGDGGKGGNGYLGSSGGNGGNGGTAGNVIFETSGRASINTSGDNAAGILLLTEGGNGGRGGAGIISPTGGNGGAGGRGDLASYRGDANVFTTGAKSSAIVVQSHGGIGGAGGTSILGSGGSGAVGADSGAAVVNSSGTVNTQGATSDGILAQSVGGFGGSGGGSVGVIAAGGDGRTAGNSSSVLVTNTGYIQTTGIDSHGIAAQSIGGGGGQGASGSGLSAEGGRGGAGGYAGGLVRVYAGAIFTFGKFSDGVLAQSIGGGGGDGGGVGGIVTIGGDGGAGGASSEVQVNTTAGIRTNADDSLGILAQSIGGSGGDGGNAISAGPSASVAVGGGGAAGGDAGKVVINGSQDFGATAADSIITTGARSVGILAQSIGGGGGDGGWTASASAGSVFSGSSAIGGSGGKGGKGDIVDLRYHGGVTTSGIDASALMAQSIGGGGGNGGFAASLSVSAGAAVSLAVGGKGGDGGSASQATAQWSGYGMTLSTSGARSDGMQVQSIGGGGGDGGLAVSGGFGLGVGAVTVGLGGDAGKASNGALARGIASGTIRTTGDESNGMLVESIGGGGGKGGGSVAGSFGGQVAISDTLGGTGGGGGAGSTASAIITGSVTTSGNDSSAVKAQSIGGGGGDAGFAGSLSAGTGVSTLSVALGGKAGDGGAAGDASASANGGTLATSGANSSVLVAQSIGGGGGTGGASVSVALLGQVTGSLGIGGTGGKGGDGGRVIVNNESGISALGDSSHAILAQSIGGGGGDGGFSVAGSLNLGVAGFGVSVGGKGESGGNSTAALLTNRGNVSTAGADATAIQVQSIGGGGGSGGFSGAVAVSSGQGALGLSLGRPGGSGGTAGTVTVSTVGDVATKGNNSQGLLAESIAGGGGNGGVSVSATAGSKLAPSISIGGAAANGGAAGVVTVDSKGNYTTAGENSQGILAQSVGGGGGTGGFAVSGTFSNNSPTLALSVGGTGGTGATGELVRLVQAGSVVTTGNGSTGIVAQSLGGGGGDGGFSGSIGASPAITSLSVSVGGNGGTGGKGNAAEATIAGNVKTSGNEAAGILTQSVGGGGGDGGLSVTGNVGNSNTISASVGGEGAMGGSAQKAQATIADGDIVTSGKLSNGIEVQSIGGGGGNGGLAVSGTFGLGGKSVAVAVGGKGGKGSTGGTAILKTNDGIMTTGAASHGIFEQSVGGGGGTGGFAGTFTVSLAGTKSLSVAVGGEGGEGADAGTVLLDTTGTKTIQTQGEGADAIFAQSVGGGGGDGGFAFNGVLGLNESSTSVSAAVGGKGGTGGIGGTVTVTNSQTLNTSGTRSIGIFAQSVGGGGGDGGVAASGSLSFNGSSKQLSLAVGGKGGTGGVAQLVTVKNTGFIGTTGSSAAAILAQSVGGGGGNGGVAFTGAFSGMQAINTSISIGGDGGIGGAGGAVTVDNSARIFTLKDGSTGIYAQSVGGGGGIGGASGAITTSKGASWNIGLDVGGVGGSGNVSDKVTVANSARIATYGESADAIVAQSIGGGGGHGGMAGVSPSQFADYLAGGGQGISFGDDTINLTTSVGGNGGTGGDGAAVSVTNSGELVTNGNYSHAIFAQSVGGGGGDAGIASATAGALGATRAVSFAMAIGGKGGAAGNGKAVTVKNTGMITTKAIGSDGIYAQSVGGGGGDGGNAAGVAETAIIDKNATKDSQYNASLSIGGKGGAAGNGGDVTVENDGKIYTTESDSYGIFAQSVGGGGGMGGSIGGNGSEHISLYNAFGFFKAFGVTAPKSNAINIGGQGGAAGKGGQVTVKSSQTVFTQGDSAHAIMAQSVGGGGGMGGDGSPGRVDVGGQGGAAGNGGAVAVTNSGLLIAKGSLARGIFAQSVGGGGGEGGSTATLPPSLSLSLNGAFAAGANIAQIKDLISSALSPSLGLAIGGKGGAAGDGGQVDVSNSGTIATNGDYGHGIFAQSVGGGGGTGGEGVLSKFGQIVFSGSGGSSGDGGAVKVNNISTISTTGADAYGIFAQSVGGGGGLIGNSAFAFLGSMGFDGRSDAVTLVNSGDVTASGEDGIAIMLQSDAKSNRGNITATLSGSITGGSGLYGKGVFISGGNDNTITNSGVISAASGQALIAGVGNETVINKGTITGNIDLGAGNNSFTNDVGGVFNAGSSIFVLGSDGFIHGQQIKASGGLFTNKGTFAPGGDGVVKFVLLSGMYAQAASGILSVDVADQMGVAGMADQLSVFGTGGVGKASLSGTVRVNLIGGLRMTSGLHRFTIVNAENGLTDSNLSVRGTPTEITSYSLSKIGSNTLALDINVNFMPRNAAFTTNQQSVGQAITAIEQSIAPPTGTPKLATARRSGDGEIAVKAVAAADPYRRLENDLSALFYDSTPADLERNYEEYSPHSYAANLASASQAASAFNDVLLNCQTESTISRPDGDRCAWARMGTHRFHSSAQGEGFSEVSTGVQGGADFAVADGWRLGGGISIESVNNYLSDISDNDGWRVQFGATAKGAYGPVDIEAAVSAGTQQIGMKRQVMDNAHVDTARATQTLWFETGTLRLAHSFTVDGWYVRPRVDLTLGGIHAQALRENGADALSLDIGSSDTFTARATPSVELGWQWKDNDIAIHPFVRGGLQAIFAGRAPEVDAMFAGAPASVPAIVASEALDRIAADVGGGIAILRDDGLSINAYYAGQYGSTMRDNRFGADLHIPF